MQERLLPVLMPLSLREFDCSNQLIGLIVGSLPSVLNIMVNPWVSFRSDRTRSKWGRRIPYLAATTPIAAIFMVMIGWAPKLGDMLASLFGGTVSSATFGLVLLVLFCILYQFFNLFVSSVFYYLFADVMPEQFMGRFVASFNLVGFGAGFVFQTFLLGYAKDYMPWIYTVTAILYCIFFTAMCFMVREGSYPPPEDNGENTGLIANIKLYFRECFSIPFYLWFFLGTALNTTSTVCRGLFGIFFAQQNIGLSLEEYGKINGYIALLIMVLSYPLGWLADRLHPLRVYISAVVLVIITNIFSYFYTISSLRSWFPFKGNHHQYIQLFLLSGLHQLHHHVCTAGAGLCDSGSEHSADVRSVASQGPLRSVLFGSGDFQCASAGCRQLGWRAVH